MVPRAEDPFLLYGCTRRTWLSSDWPINALDLSMLCMGRLEVSQSASIGLVQKKDGQVRKAAIDIYLY